MENELEIFFNTTQDLMCIANPEGFFERVNPQFTRILGYSEKELVENPFITFVHPDDHKATIRETERLTEGQPTINFTNRYRKKDGEYIWLEWSATSHKGKFYAVARDVTKQQDLIRELEDGRKRFAQLSEQYEFATESAGIGVWIWDVKEDTLKWNDQMYKLYGLGKNEFEEVYEGWHSRLHPQDAERVDEDIQKALRGEKKYDTSFRVLWKDGTTRYIRAFGNVARDDEGEAVSMTGVNWDFTKEKDLDIARSNFISFASHQLRTPLTGIRWVADQLASEQLSEKGKQYLSDIEESSMRLAKLVDVLLNLSRLEGGHVTVKPEIFDLILLMDEFLDEMEGSLRQKNLTLTKEPYPRQLDVRSDRFMLQNILQSIVSNAIEYTPEGGKVTVGVLEKDKMFEITVSDTGVGIPKDDRATIFEQFSRGSNADEMKTNGTGLGLYIAKHSVDLLQGKIWFDSEEDKGTTFHIELPRRIETKEV